MGMKYLLLSTGYTSCIVRLSNNDDETRFFPVLLDRERSLLGYHLKRLGEDHLPPALPVNIEQTICQLWPTSIPIDRGTSHDFFLLQESSELNEFKRIPNPRTDVLPDSSPTTRDQNTGLLRLLTTSSSAENSPVISKDETFPSPMNAKPQSKHVTNRDSDGSNSSFKQQLRSTSTNSVGAYKPPTSELPVSYPSGRQRATPGDRIMNEAHLDNLLAFNHVPSTLRSSTDAQVITLKNDDRTAYIKSCSSSLNHCLFEKVQHIDCRSKTTQLAPGGVKGIYRFSTSFSFSLKMFLSSPRVDSIFSRENWFSPSEDLSFATQELSSVTVLSSSVHSFRRISTFFTHSSETALTLLYLSFRA